MESSPAADAGGVAAEGERCTNCNSACAKPMRCSICKAAAYCSQKCQKEDWRFHKRNCKKPPEKDKEDASALAGLAQKSEAQEMLEKELAGQDPNIAQQVKQMMAGMGLGGETAEKKAAPPAAKRETCKNCMLECEKPLRCGVCKAATYCSSKCQKEDWQFHKRNCKKPTAEAPKLPVAKKEEMALPEASKSEPLRPKASEKEVVKDEDVGTWYSHRDWKPKEEKKEFAPSRVDSEVTSAAPQTASTWNAAGTWEEKNMVPWFADKLKALKALAVDTFAGRITVDTLSEIGGEAQIVHIRGTPRFLFDLRFELNFSVQYKTSSRAYKGQVKVLEFSNEVAVAKDEFPVEVTAHSDSDKRAAEQKFVPLLQAALREYVAEYEQTVAKPAAGAFPGQLPPARRPAPVEEANAAEEAKTAEEAALADEAAAAKKTKREATAVD